MAEFMEDDWQIQEFEPSEIDYDPNKDLSNWKKHGVWFEEAAQSLVGPVIARCQIVNFEERWIAVGIFRGKLLTTVFVERNDEIRIISSRGATPSEKRWHGAHFI
jgi:uncharacterized protein